MTNDDTSKDKVVNFKVIPKPPPEPLPQPDGQHCGSCHFWMPYHPQAADGFCRRYPPAQFFGIGKVGDQPPEPRWQFPGMNKEGWCGEWRALQEAAAKVTPSD